MRARLESAAAGHCSTELWQSPTQQMATDTRGWCASGERASSRTMQLQCRRPLAEIKSAKPSTNASATLLLSPPLSCLTRAIQGTSAAVCLKRHKPDSQHGRHHFIHIWHAEGGPRATELEAICKACRERPQLTELREAVRLEITGGCARAGRWRRSRGRGSTRRWSS